jgi:uncharacterized protein
MTATPSQSEKILHTPNLLVDWLSTPTPYSERPAAVRRVETHISCVFLTERFAYKLKKPVRFDFLDFSTVELRKRACEEEIRLNRRLAPEVYLGLVAVRRNAAGQFVLDEANAVSSEEVVDWLVKMHRLPDEATLLAKIDGGTARKDDAYAIAARLAEFYRASQPLAISPPQYRAEIEKHVWANRTELLREEHGLNSAAVKRIHAAQLRLLLLRPEVFDARAMARRIVDGHGDLRPEHIYLLPSDEARDIQPAIIDCIEFNAEFRHLDVADELSFLATECDFAGAEKIGRRIFERTSETLHDRPPPALLAFYRSYRACVRAKVAALRAAQQTADARAESYAETVQRLQWAERYDQQLPAPFLLVVCGLMGSGKSTLAGKLAALLGAEVVATDAIRREVFGESKAPLEYGAGHYSPQDRSQIYDRMFDQARNLLHDGLPVILDGAFPYARLREAALQLGGENAVPLIVHCRCPEDVARARIAARLAEGSCPSEARPELYVQQRDEEETHSAAGIVVEIDTTNELELQIESVTERLRQVYAMRLPRLEEN